VSTLAGSYSRSQSNSTASLYASKGWMFARVHVTSKDDEHISKEGFVAAVFYGFGLFLFNSLR
jgi:hypothetical protein